MSAYEQCLGKPSLLERVADQPSLTQRVKNCLAAKRIKYIGQLVTLTPKELLDFPQLGEGSLDNITAVLNDMGLCLGVECEADVDLSTPQGIAKFFGIRDQLLYDDCSSGPSAASASGMESGPRYEVVRIDVAVPGAILTDFGRVSVIERLRPTCAKALSYLADQRQPISKEGMDRDLDRLFLGKYSGGIPWSPADELNEVPIVLAYNNSSSAASGNRDLAKVAAALGGGTLWPYVRRYFEP